MKTFFLFSFLFFSSLWATPLEKVSLQLQWKHQFEFAGFYAAKEKGFYKDAGLDVEFLEFDENTNITQVVLDNKAQYGLTYSSIIAEYLNEKPVVLVANFFKQSPLVLVAQKEIQTLNDLKGKKVMGISEGIDHSTLLAMLNKFDISTHDIINIPTNFSVDDFINKKIDAVSIFTTNELYYLEKSGVQYTIFDPVLYGAKYYDLNLFTSKEEIKNHPKRVEKFRDASIKGWKYALEHKEEIIDLILQKYNTQNKSKEALMFEAAQTEKIMLQNVYEIGSVDLDRLKIIADTFVESGYVQKGKNKDLEHFIYGYEAHRQTLNFSQQEKEYLQRKKEITLCADPDWMPFEAIKEGEVVGLNKEFIQIAQESLGIPFKLVATKTWSESLEYVQTKRCDILSLVSQTDAREKYLNFTTPHLEVPQVIVTKMDKPSILDIGILEDQTIACVKNYSIIDMIKQKYKNIKIVEVENIQEGLDLVRNDKVFGFADTSIAIGYYIQNGFFTDLKISASFDEKVSLGFGIPKENLILYGLLEKVVQNISEERKHDIMKKWFFIKQEVGFDYSLFWKMIAVFVFLLAFFLYRDYELKKLNKKLQNFATTDSLTGLVNRRQFNDTLHTEFSRAVRERAPISVLMLDIDMFKNYNDSFGHQSGDTCLFKVAQAIQRSINRAGDLVARYGGEEFVVIAPSTSEQSAKKLAEKIRLEVESLNIEHPKSPYSKVTMSIGSASITPSAQSQEQELLSRADQALYKAKESGRNCCVSFCV